MPLLTSQFIKDVLVADIRTMQEHELLYLSIIPLSAGIELLGALVRNREPLEENGHRKQRFDRAISDLFPSEYKRFIDRDPSLYVGLRCWGVHQLRLGGYGLLSAAEARSLCVKHLEERTGMVVLICETLFKDFEEACLKVVKRLQDGEIPNEPFLWLPGDVLATKPLGTLDLGTAPASGVYLPSPK